jgi:serine/threonine-protein kinase
MPPAARRQGDSNRSDAHQGPLAQVSILDPTLFGRYTIVGKLGHSRLAELLLAVPQQVDAPPVMVIKRLHKYLAADPEFVDSFCDEMGAASLPDHPNLAVVLDHGVEDDHCFVAREYLEGVGLDRFLRRCQSRGVRLGPALAANVALQLLEGLHHAHEVRDDRGAPLGLVHRDLRPRHVFVTVDGIVKILDLGLAPIVVRRIQSSLNQLKGPLQYSAPENVLGETVDRRVDVWAVGVMLWEALAGRALFPDAASVADLMRLILDAPIPDLADAAVGVPPEVARVTAGALRRDRDERYETAQAMADELRAAVADLPEARDRAALGAVVGELFNTEIEAERVLVASAVGTTAAARPAARSGIMRAASGLAPAVPRRPHRERLLTGLVVALVAALLAAAAVLRVWRPWEG